jgi:hypothetical protein
VPNLFAYWVGNLAACIPTVGILLTLLHVTPKFQSWTHGLATSSAGRHIQLGIGVLALSIAVLMTVRLLTRPRQQANVPTPGDNASTLVLAPPVISRILDRAPDAAPTEGGSAFRRLFGHFHNAWENGSLWVALVIGMVSGGPAIDLTLIVLTVAMASGAAIGTQVIVAIAFIVATLAVVEITLVSHLVAPTKSEAVLQLLHEWAFAQRRKILVAMFAVGGVSLMANGLSGI